MTGKLYPPRIEASLPAFVKSADSCILVIPFQLNRAVSRNEFNQVRLRLKTVQTQTVICDGVMTETINFDNSSGHWKASFDLSSYGLTVGQYYKAQIAFSQNDAIGYYSDMALVKCTAKPNIYIKNMDAESTTNTHAYEYTGIYATNGDLTEKAYSYCFNLYDENNQLVETSGEQLHNSSADTEKGESSDTWLVTKTLKPGYWYSIQYVVTTINNLTVASPAYKVMEIETVDLNIGATLTASMEMDDGYIDVWLKPLPDMKKNIHGSFLLTRASSNDEFKNWQELYRFEILNEFPDKHLWQDFTVEQGIQYKYALQAFNDNGLYSNRMENIEGPILAEFEDMFLFDGERQLNIRFNPQVSSFKANILETKLDTIGSKYPFIFRSGHVNYKEFPISGLLSMLSDTNELFVNGVLPAAASTRRDRTNSERSDFGSLTQLSSDNFYRERTFKMEVLEWLNNGQPKLFRSPGEGNYIVRLMNTSLTPNDTLGRMLHTFSTTAYEVADCNYKTLNEYGFIKSLQREYRGMQIDQQLLSTIFGYSTTPEPKTTYYFPAGAYFLSIADQYTSALVFEFHFLNGTVINWNIQNPTGQFNIPITDSPVVKMVYKYGTIESEATITYGTYTTNITNDFSLITKIESEDRIEQITGRGIAVNMIDELIDVRHKLGRFYYIKLAARPVYRVYTNDNLIYYWDAAMINPVENWDATVLYAVQGQNVWLNGSPSSILTEEPSFRAAVNSQSFTDLARIDRGNGQETSARFEAISDIDEVTTLRLGTGVIADLVYQYKTIEYVVENTDMATKNAKLEWQHKQSVYKGFLRSEEATEEQIAAAKNAMDVAYAAYIRQLKIALDRAQEDLIYAI